jgi:hypothetical protein
MSLHATTAGLLADALHGMRRAGPIPSKLAPQPAG